ncbi:MAG: ribulose-phosphate 3-epimerase [Microgenomates group bacterium Gr01-1014_93]|nr:MAG: ribulose-phosphate 3-epimerase [Microgenomates group bacterium Gr01-1014_93]
MQVIPGILESNWETIEEALEKVKTFSNTVHIDLIDGKFSKKKTFLDPQPFSTYTKELFFEAHLMTDNPIEYLEAFAKIGFKRFIGHVEKMPDAAEFVAKGQFLGEVGLALDLSTDIDNIKVPFDDLDVILLMGVTAGASGQEFMPQALEKIKALRARTNIVIEVDGGVNDKNIREIKNAGTNRFVTTSFVFKNIDPIRAYKSLVTLITD